MDVPGEDPAPRPEGPAARQEDPSPWKELLLDTWREGQRLSAVGPGPVESHLEHSARLAEQLDAPDRAVDLGSGAGIPGLALAGLWPGSQWLLVEAARRRAHLLRAAVDRLGWADRVTVGHGRAEELARTTRWRGWADLVVARSFGSPASTAECGVAFLRQHGLLVVTEPPNDAGERWPAAPLAMLGLAAVPAPTEDRVKMQRLELVGPVPEQVPRRPGIPAKRPRF